MPNDDTFRIYRTDDTATAQRIYVCTSLTPAEALERLIVERGDDPRRPWRIEIDDPDGLGGILADVQCSLWPTHGHYIFVR